MITIIAARILKERLTMQKIIGLIMGASGAYINCIKRRKCTRGKYFAWRFAGSFKCNGIYFLFYIGEAIHEKILCN